jgi:hypothetical protein
MSSSPGTRAARQLRETDRRIRDRVREHRSPNVLPGVQLSVGKLNPAGLSENESGEQSGVVPGKRKFGPSQDVQVGDDPPREWLRERRKGSLVAWHRPILPNDRRRGMRRHRAGCRRDLLRCCVEGRAHFRSSGLQQLANLGCIGEPQEPGPEVLVDKLGDHASRHDCLGEQQRGEPLNSRE